MGQHSGDSLTNSSSIEMCHCHTQPGAEGIKMQLMMCTCQFPTTTISYVHFGMACVVYLFWKWVPRWLFMLHKLFAIYNIIHNIIVLHDWLLCCFISHCRFVFQNTSVNCKWLNAVIPIYHVLYSDYNVHETHDSSFITLPIQITIYNGMR